MDGLISRALAGQYASPMPPYEEYVRQQQAAAAQAAHEQARAAAQHSLNVKNNADQLAQQYQTALQNPQVLNQQAEAMANQQEAQAARPSSGFMTVDAGIAQPLGSMARSGLSQLLEYGQLYQLAQEEATKQAMREQADYVRQVYKDRGVDLDALGGNKGIGYLSALLAADAQQAQSRAIEQATPDEMYYKYYNAFRDEGMSDAAASDAASRRMREYGATYARNMTNSLYQNGVGEGALNDQGMNIASLMGTSDQSLGPLQLIFGSYVRPSDQWNFGRQLDKAGYINDLKQSNMSLQHGYDMETLLQQLSGRGALRKMELDAQAREADKSRAFKDYFTEKYGIPGRGSGSGKGNDGEDGGIELTKPEEAVVSMASDLVKAALQEADNGDASGQAVRNLTDFLESEDFKKLRDPKLKETLNGYGYAANFIREKNAAAKARKEGNAEKATMFEDQAAMYAKGIPDDLKKELFPDVNFSDWQ